MRFVRSLSALAVIALSLSAAYSAQGGQASTGKTYTVHIKGFKFDPETIEVAKGDTVIWINDDVVPHTATAKGVFDSKGLDQGKSWSYVASTPGTYPYICTFHQTMKAKLIVH